MTIAAVHYRAAPTCGQFHRSPAFVRGLRGPLGSGKSTACVLELYIRAHGLEPCSDGVRRSRFVVVRNTYAELRSTTIRTFAEWFGPAHHLPPVVYDTPIRWQHRWQYAGAPAVDMEVLFISMDRPDDVRKMKSLDVTGVWLNEASELPKAVLDMATGRVGRYPHAKDKPPGAALWPSWSGVIMDSNSMDDDHWWYTLAEEEIPEGYAFFTQPGGFAELAENLAHLPGARGYYTRMAQGKREDWVRVYIDCQYGSTQDGRPVWPEYNDRLHASESALGIYRGLPLWLGFDFGLTPACVALQVSPRGQVRVLREWLVEGGTMGIRQFGSTIVKPALTNEFAGMKIQGYGDPGGAQRAQTDEQTAIEVLNQVGIPTVQAKTNLFTPRRDAVANQLTRLVDGEPALLLDPSCRRLRKAMNGGYRFRRMAVAGHERFQDVPDKNELSHIAESLQYVALHVSGELPSARPRLPRHAPRPLDRAFGY